MYYELSGFNACCKLSGVNAYYIYRIAGKFGGQKIWRIARNRREN